MNVRNDKEYLEELISQGEHRQQDFKYKIQNPAKLAKSVSAFANTSGGRLLIGVRDDGQPAGVKSAEETFMMEKAAEECCLPAAAISFRTINFDGRNIVIATIPEAEKKPVYALDEQERRTAYVRIDDENVVASPVFLEMWKQDKASTVVMSYTQAETGLIRTMQLHPAATLNRIVKLSTLGRYKVIKTLARFIRYDLARVEHRDGKFLFSLVSDGSFVE